MNFRIRGLLGLLAFMALASAPAFAQNAYITNYNANSVSVIDTTTNTVSATINVVGEPYGVAVSPDGSRVYITNAGANTVSVINTATNTVIDTIPVGNNPFGVAVSPDGSKVHV